MASGGLGPAPSSTPSSDASGRGRRRAVAAAFLLAPLRKEFEGDGIKHSDQHIGADARRGVRAAGEEHRGRYSLPQLIPLQFGGQRQALAKQRGQMLQQVGPILLDNLRLCLLRNGHYHRRLLGKADAPRCAGEELVVLLVLAACAAVAITAVGRSR